MNLDFSILKEVKEVREKKTHNSQNEFVKRKKKKEKNLFCNHPPSDNHKYA